MDEPLLMISCASGSLAPGYHSVRDPGTPLRTLTWATDREGEPVPGGYFYVENANDQMATELLAFACLLNKSRRSRGVEVLQSCIYADRTRPTSMDVLCVPHITYSQTREAVHVFWELLASAEAEAAFAAPIDIVARWASRADDLTTLAKACWAEAERGPRAERLHVQNVARVLLRRLHEDRCYLSFRYVVTNSNWLEQTLYGCEH